MKTAFVLLARDLPVHDNPATTTADVPAPLVHAPGTAVAGYAAPIVDRARAADALGRRRARAA